MFFLPRRFFLRQTALGLVAVSSLVHTLPSQAEEILIQSPPEGFKAIFDGKSFFSISFCQLPKCCDDFRGISTFDVQGNMEFPVDVDEDIPVELIFASFRQG